jgi:hypothetical protein
MSNQFSATLRSIGSAVVLLGLLPNSVAAGGLRREPKLSHVFCDHCRYTRESNHGLLHYPNATYWTSGDAIDHWGASGRASFGSYDVAPSPWAYRSITPYPHHYRASYGDSYGWNDCYDCRN